MITVVIILCVLVAVLSAGLAVQTYRISKEEGPKGEPAEPSDIASLEYMEAAGNHLAEEYWPVYDALAQRTKA